MTNDRSDNNTDLRAREPLRIAFAFGALLLGLVAGMPPDTYSAKHIADNSTATSPQPWQAIEDGHP